MSKAGYSEIGKSGKYFNCREKKEIDSLFIYNGYKANFVQLESGFFLRVDSAKKVVRNETVLDFINYFYKTHDGKDRE
jgi:type IV secretory pathway VirB4 component